jgi:hypothetical protein
MMDKYIKNIGDEFTANGGFREKMSTARNEARVNQEGIPAETPKCPQCGAQMRLRKTRKDNKSFWGCTGYPACRGIVEYKE